MPCPEEFFQAYVTTALWSSNDESDPETGGDPMDANYSKDDIELGTLAEMRADCDAFYEANETDLNCEGVTYGPDFGQDGRAGHDFWLTRNHRIYPLTASKVAQAPAMVGALRFGYRAVASLEAMDQGGMSGMHVPDAARRSVIFIGGVEENGSFTPRGTGFLVYARDQGSNFIFPHVVTAEHVVSGMQRRGLEIFCRVNTRNGGASVQSMKEAEWWFHPDAVNLTDVAVAPMGLRPDVDHDFIPLFESPVDDRFPRLGDEVFLVGLFRSHFGNKRNVPIVRVGNIAAVPSEAEPVKIPYAGYTEAYLVEMRSIGGISGSPVLKEWFRETVQNLPHHMIVDPRTRPSDPEEINWFDYHLVGLVHGHFDVEDLREASVNFDANEKQKRSDINTGIGVVIPRKKIMETLYQPDLAASRKAVQEAEFEGGATADADFSSVPGERPSSAAASDKNPRHREDFTSLLNAAAKTKPQGE